MTDERRRDRQQLGADTAGRGLAGDAELGERPLSVHRWGRAMSSHHSGYGESWPDRRREALERDDFECQRCGLGRDEHRDRWGADLHVHHETSIGEYDDVEDAHELTNLVTLCEACHQERHSEERAERGRKFSMERNPRAIEDERVLAVFRDADGRELTTREATERLPLSHAGVYSRLQSMAERGLLSRRRPKNAVQWSLANCGDE